ncbi:4'-phosphopantetheinyl transferase family protein [Streptomyces sp. NPDC056683]|uniref:4'-phosphopantetheinyl transferase family protein n=1 Tax=Streptomyces sp. NPDC056683 TaxID=3345910 RepID=UPI0036972481
MSDAGSLPSAGGLAEHPAGAPPSRLRLADWAAGPAGDPTVRLWAPAPGVTVVLAHTDAVLSALEAVDRLRPEEYRSAATMAPWRGREHLAGRALLRLLLAEVAGEEDARAPVVPEPAGRPRLPGSPGTGVSISHSGSYVAAAVGAGLDVGVDVQVARPPSPAMVRRCCTPRTAARLASMAPDRAARVFARVWTVQEACVKAHGTGLSGAPWRVRAAPDGRAGTWGGLHWRRPPRPAAVCAETITMACAFGPAEARPPHTTGAAGRRPAPVPRRP